MKNLKTLLVRENLDEVTAMLSGLKEGLTQYANTGFAIALSVLDDEFVNQFFDSKFNN